MTQASRIRKNSFFVFLSSLIRLASNVLLFVGIARLYGPEAFGQFTTAHTFSTIFIIFADFGFDFLLASEVARQRDRATELAQRFFTIKLLFAAAATVAMMFVPLFSAMSASTALLISIFAFSVFFTAVGNFFFAYFKGFEELHYETTVSFITNVGLLATLVVAGVLHVPLVVVALLFLGSRVLVVVLSLGITVRRFGVRSFHPTLTGWRDSLRDVMIFGIHYLCGSLYFTQDTILLSWWKGDHDVGLYQSVFKIVLIFLILPDIAINTLLPTLSRLNVGDEDRWIRTGALVQKILALVAFPIAGVIFVYPEQILALVYGGTAFAEAAPVLRIFSAILLIRFIAETPALMLTTSRRQIVRMVIAIGGVLLNVAANAYAIPRYGIAGAAVVSLVTNVFVAAGYLCATRPFLRRWGTDVRILLPGFAMILCTAALWQLRTEPIWYAAPIATAFYGAIVYVFGFTREERRLVFAAGPLRSPVRDSA